MNKGNAHLFLPIVQALTDGKQLQYRDGCKDNPYWVDFEDDDQIGFHTDPEDYRIKPEPRTFEVFYHKTTDTVVTARKYTELGGDWERITVQEVL